MSICIDCAKWLTCQDECDAGTRGYLCAWDKRPCYTPTAPERALAGEHITDVGQLTERELKELNRLARNRKLVKAKSYAYPGRPHTTWFAIP